MNTTPLWVPLVVALIGVIGTAGGTIGGMLIQQRASRQRERAQWTREDEARTFEHRRETYVEFYRSLRKLVERVVDLDEHEPLPAWRDEMFEQFPNIAVYGSEKVAILADQALDLVLAWASSKSQGKQVERWRRSATEAVDDLRRAIREELGVPEGGTLNPSDLVNVEVDEGEGNASSH